MTTAIHLGFPVPGTPEWEAARSGLCITATEIAAVVGLSPWQSRFTLWHKKAGLPTAPFEPSPQMEWGNRLESAVATKWQEGAPDRWLETAGTWQHSERDWQRATPDRLVYEEPVDWPDTLLPVPPTALLEVKTSPTGDAWADGIPIYYQCQIQWQLDTLGLQVCHLALLVGGHDYREFVIEYDADDAQYLRREARAFLDTVEAGERPPIDDSDSTYDTVRAQHESRDDVEVEIPAALADRYEAAGAAKRKADAARQQASAEVMDAIGEGRWATVAGRRIAQRTTKNALQPCKQKASTT
ncbi:lambda-exonuclease family protein [Streptomyces lonarensis]|uniref:YqaJ viral recombinase domain-containing protein n=1 Tax=Streptomyces lonarensis TaxID=700599 RepID=A0A7X6CXJ3_9ACTN|nr:YqaJ viral recombinase family protein [Streptomyces lonarensis]NJQ04238.1 hypothetical protein [Streptomyces lonarensis]